MRIALASILIVIGITLLTLNLLAFTIEPSIPDGDLDRTKDSVPGYHYAVQELGAVENIQHSSKSPSGKFMKEHNSG